MKSKQLFRGFALAPIVVAAVAAMPAPTSWNVDPAHTSVAFDVRHFFTPVKGQFEEFEVSLAYDRDNPANSTVHVKIPVASVNTANEKRDNHLRSDDFFAAEAHPFITFESERVTQVSQGVLLVRGPLTIRGTTRIVELPVKVLGVMDVAPEMRDMLGARQIASFQAQLTLDRRDFGVGAGSWAETAIVGSNVSIEIAVEANR